MSLVRRLKSYSAIAQVSVGVAARAALSREAAQRYLLRSMGGFPGAPAKGAQILGQILGVEAEEVAQPSPLKLEVVAEILAEENPKLADCLVEISDQPIPASLGQVHQGILKDGRTVAIKVQYPGLEQVLDEQFGTILLALKRSPAAAAGLDVQAYERTLRDQMMAELDYTHEARNQRQLRAWGEKIGVAVPDVDLVLTTRRVLVQEYIAVSHLADLVDQDEQVRLAVATNLLRFFLAAFSADVPIHGDLQPQNWGVTDGRVVIFDFGHTLDVPPSMRDLVVDTLLDYDRLTSGEIATRLVALGFRADLVEIAADELAALTYNLFGLFSQQPAPAQPVDRAKTWAFRAAGPPWFLLLMRVGFQVKTALRQLAAEEIFPMMRIELEMVRRQPTPPSSQASATIAGDPIYLRVRVTEHGKEVVSVQLPSRALDNLEYLIPENVRTQVAQRHDLAAIRDAALKSGCQPGVLFEERLGNRHYKVWLG